LGQEERLRLRVLALLAALTAAPSGAAAERGHPPIHPYVLGAGDKVRLWTAGGGGALVAESAMVTASDHTGMMVVVRDQTRLVPFEEVTRLEVRRGRSWARRGALLGLGVGVLAGAWLLADEMVSDGSAEPEDRVRQGLLLGAAGAAVGGITGYALHPARWEPVSIESVRPRPAAPAASLSLRF
jgi:hypothetical protein